MIYLFSDSSNVNSILNKGQYTLVDHDYFDFDSKIESEDILILDIDNFDSLEKIMYSFMKLPKTLKVIAFVKEPKLSHGAFLIKKGFKSYIGKDTAKQIIQVVIDSVSNGNVWLYPQLMNFIIQHINLENEENNSSEFFDKLSKKEQEVATLVSTGLSNKEIAKTLEVQLVTVKKHISHIFTKLNIRDRLSLALLINK